ncbi:hypothetical protein [Variovorax sp. 770b2]|jgi:hypothetical protein|uniref:hypothetical protein n=1 Tax=Variovorax sp. 770b2 TaxID=1566271 RepID=UPI001160A891|nr:hypothetical protein [Variovorax sp. 770b2]
MKEIAKTMAIMIFLCLQFFEIVRADISNETACYVSSDGKPARFEFHSYHDSGRKWSGGFVRYEHSTESVPVIFISSTMASDLGEGILEPSSKWLEISRGRISGEYVFMREGVGTGVSGYVATYRNYEKNKARNFVLDPAAGFEESGCKWVN